MSHAKGEDDDDAALGAAPGATAAAAAASGAAPVPAPAPRADACPPGAAALLLSARWRSLFSALLRCDALPEPCRIQALRLFAQPMLAAALGPEELLAVDTDATGAEQVEQEQQEQDEEQDGQSVGEKTESRDSAEPQEQEHRAGMEEENPVEKSGRDSVEQLFELLGAVSPERDAFTHEHTASQPRTVAGTGSGGGGGGALRAVAYAAFGSDHTGGYVNIRAEPSLEASNVRDTHLLRSAVDPTLPSPLPCYGHLTRSWCRSSRLPPTLLGRPRTWRCCGYRRVPARCSRSRPAAPPLTTVIALPMPRVSPTVRPLYRLTRVTSLTTTGEWFGVVWLGQHGWIRARAPPPGLPARQMRTEHMASSPAMVRSSNHNPLFNRQVCPPGSCAVSTLPGARWCPSASSRSPAGTASCTQAACACGAGRTPRATATRTAC